MRYLLIALLIGGCCSTKTSTVEMKDTTATFGGIKETTPLFVLDNNTFSGSKVDSSGDTSYTVTLKLDSGVTIQFMDSSSIVGLVDKLVDSVLPKKKKKVGDVTVDVKPKDVPVSYPQTVNNTTITWYDKLLDKMTTILLFFSGIIIALFFIKQIFK